MSDKLINLMFLEKHTTYLESNKFCDKYVWKREI